MAKHGQAFQQRLHSGLAGALKLAGDLVGASFAKVLQGIADGGDLFGQVILKPSAGRSEDVGQIYFTFDWRTLSI